MTYSKKIGLVNPIGFTLGFSRANGNQSETLHVSLKSFVISVEFFRSNRRRNSRTMEEISKQKETACSFSLKVTWPTCFFVLSIRRNVTYLKWNKGLYEEGERNSVTNKK